MILSTSGMSKSQRSLSISAGVWFEREAIKSSAFCDIWLFTCGEWYLWDNASLNRLLTRPIFIFTWLSQKNVFNLAKITLARLFTSSFQAAILTAALVAFIDCTVPSSCPEIPKSKNPSLFSNFDMKSNWWIHFLIIKIILITSLESTSKIYRQITEIKSVDNIQCFRLPLKLLFRIDGKACNMVGITFRLISYLDLINKTISLIKAW